MATTVARLEAVLSADTKGFDRGMDQSQSKMGKVGKAAGLMGLALAGGLAVGAKNAIEDASNLNEQMNKTLVVFGKNGKGVQEWSKGLARDFGISSRAALEAAGTFGNMLVPMGIARPLASKMSKSMVELAGDMSSFNNASPEETLDAIRSGLAGQTEPLRKFGVFLSEDAIKAEALSSGLVKANVSMADVHVRQAAVAESRLKLAEATAKYGKGSLEATTAQAKLEYAEKKLHEVLAGKVPALTAAQKATATYGLITKDTKDAQGDFARTSDGLANQQRILKAEMENLSAELGTHLLPIVIKVMEAVLKATEFFKQHKTTTKVLVGAIVVLTAALLAASVAQTLLNLAFLASPIGLIVLAIAGLAAGIFILWKKSETFRTAVGLLWDLLKLSPLAQVITHVDDLWRAFKTVSNWVEDAYNWLKKLIQGIKDLPSKIKLDLDLNIGSKSAWWNKGLKDLIGDPADSGMEFGSASVAGVSPHLNDEIAGGLHYGLRVTSGLRPGARTKHGTLSDHATGHAVDMAGPASGMASFFRWLIGQADVKQAFYDPLGSIFGGVLSSYREGGHSDHVHVASYDQGGYLRPGWNLAYNGLGRPEPVGAGNVTFNFPNYVGSKSELMTWIQNGSQQFKRRNGRSPF